MARNTRTGGVLEQMVLPALDQGGYTYETQVNLGQRLGLGRHFIDAVAEKDGHKFLISVKWQQVSGTAEQKVPFEVICLIEALAAGNFEIRFRAASHSLTSTPRIEVFAARTAARYTCSHSGLLAAASWCRSH